MITGASSGIGKAFAFQLAALKMNLILIARRTKQLEEISEALRKQAVTVEILSIDLTQHVQRRQLVDIFKNKDVTLLINNAGFGGKDEKYSSMQFNDIQNMLELNIVVPAELSYHALQSFKIKDFPCGILNISSLAAFKALPNSILYGSTKSFLKEFSLGLSEEYKTSNVQISVACPGNVKTEMFAMELGVELEKIKPSIFVLEVDECAKLILKAFFSGKKFIIPGFTSKMLYLLINFLPRAFISQLEQSSK